MNITICNLRNKTNVVVFDYDVRVDRSSPLGSPFVLHDESERDKVCDEYEAWFYGLLNDGWCLEQDSVCRELDRLKALYKKHGKLRLFCWCIPKRCHAITIKKYLEETCTI